MTGIIYADPNVCNRPIIKPGKYNTFALSRHNDIKNQRQYNSSRYSKSKQEPLIYYVTVNKQHEMCPESDVYP